MCECRHKRNLRHNLEKKNLILCGLAYSKKWVPKLYTQTQNYICRLLTQTTNDISIQFVFDNCKYIIVNVCQIQLNISSSVQLNSIAIQWVFRKLNCKKKEIVEIGNRSNGMKGSLSNKRMNRQNPNLSLL